MTCNRQGSGFYKYLYCNIISLWSSMMLMWLSSYIYIPSSKEREILCLIISSTNLRRSSSFQFSSVIVTYRIVMPQRLEDILEHICLWGILYPHHEQLSKNNDNNLPRLHMIPLIQPSEALTFDHIPYEEGQPSVKQRVKETSESDMRTFPWFNWSVYISYSHSFCHVVLYIQCIHTLFVRVPATIIISLWRGLGRNMTPKRSKSYRLHTQGI